MNLSLNSDKFLEYFFDYLSKSGVSSNSFKYYRSDISHFSGWMILKVRTWGIFAESILEVIPFIKASLAGEYRDFLIKNNVSPKTVNRRLTSLRHLSRFLILSQISAFDFMEGKSPAQAEAFFLGALAGARGVDKDQIEYDGMAGLKSEITKTLKVFLGEAGSN